MKDEKFLQILIALVVVAAVLFLLLFLSGNFDAVSTKGFPCSLF